MAPRFERWLPAYSQVATGTFLAPRRGRDRVGQGQMIGTFTLNLVTLVFQRSRRPATPRDGLCSVDPDIVRTGNHDYVRPGRGERLPRSNRALRNSGLSRVLAQFGNRYANRGE